MPSTKRCVFGCVTIGVSCHRFPSPRKYPKRFRMWVELAKDSLKNMSDDYIYNCRRVCSIHFSDDDYNRNHRLNALANPTLNLPGQVQNPGKSVNHTEASDYRPCETEACDDNNDNITLGLSLDHTQNEGENINSLYSLHTNYTPEDCDAYDDNINAGLRLEPDKATNSAPFSWNKDCDIYEIVPQAGDDEDVIYEVVEDTDDAKMFAENPSKQSDQQHNNTIKEKDATPKNKEHEGFQCNCCTNSIVGYRYSCIQCHDYDLCSACETRGAHAFHYMLRVPGPRPYEEVQSMLDLIRRQLFQSDILLKPGDANKSTPFPEDSIKVEAKDEIEEVDPFQSMVQPASVSPLLEPADELENTAQEEEKEMDAESITDLSENVSSKLISMHRQTHVSHKMKHKDSDEEFTPDLPLENVPSKRTLIHRKTRKRKLQEFHEESASNLPSENVPNKLTAIYRQKHIPVERRSQDSDESDKESATYLRLENVSGNQYSIYQETYERKPQESDKDDSPPKIKPQDSDESDEESTTDLPLENVRTKLTLPQGYTSYPQKKKPQDCDETNNESVTDLPSKNISTNYTSERRPYFPPKRKLQPEISIQQINTKNPKVVLSRIPLESLNQQKLIKSRKFSSGVANMSNKASTNIIQSKEETGALLVTPEYLGLSESDLIQLFNIEVKGRCPKRILIQVDNSKVQSQLLRQSKEKLPGSGNT